jgi:dTMP kinase
MTKGKFIVFEGIDGSGKSTICKMLKDLLTESYPEQKVHFTTEPTNGPAGKILKLNTTLSLSADWFLPTDITMHITMKMVYLNY